LFRTFTKPVIKWFRICLTKKPKTLRKETRTGCRSSIRLSRTTAIGKANGHAELRCQCGNQTKRVFETGKSLSIAIKGCCSTCGNITITSGQWRVAKNYKSYVRCHRGDTPDYALGNSLTFNDPISKVYGEDRFGWNESLHSTLKSRFGLLEDDSSMRDITEVRTEFAITGAAISVLLLERARRANVPIAPPTPIANGSASIGSGQGQAVPLPLAA
jgi:hypothetical protein